MNILFTLCGRAGSKGYENKNLKFCRKYVIVIDILVFLTSAQKEKNYDFKPGDTEDIRRIENHNENRSLCYGCGWKGKLYYISGGERGFR